MKVHKGSVHDAVATVNAFIAKYTTHICRENEEAQIKDIDVDMVYEAFTKAKDSVGGTDGWEVKRVGPLLKENVQVD